MRLVKQRIKIPSPPASIKGSDVGEFLRKIHDVLSKDLSERISATDLDLLENQTGSTLNRGDVVALGTGVDESVVLDDTAGSFSQYVVALTEPENGKKGFFSTQGITPEALVQGTISRGEYLEKSATSKALEGTGVIVGTLVAPPEGTVGVALAANASGSATIPVYLLGHTVTDLPDQTVDAAHVGTDWPHARVKRTTNQSIPDSALTPITFESEEWDTGNLWSAGSPTIFVAPRAGLYSIGACVLWESPAGGDRQIFVRTGPSGGGKTKRAAVIDEGPQTTFAQLAHTQWRLSSGDEVDIAVLQTSGNPLNILADSFAPQAWISWERP